MEQLLLVLHIIVAFLIIGLVLIQQGKGADVGAAFASGASQTVFGSQGSATFLSRSTAWLTAVFFITNIGMVYLEHRLRKPVETALDLPIPVDPNKETTKLEDVPVVPSVEEYKE